MTAGRGSQFDADLFDVFMEALPPLCAGVEQNSIPVGGAVDHHRPTADI